MLLTYSGDSQNRLGNRLSRMLLFILHRADHVAFSVFEEDQRADRWDMKLGHNDLAAVGFNRRDRVID